MLFFCLCPNVSLIILLKLLAIEVSAQASYVDDPSVPQALAAGNLATKKKEAKI
jgi:hypothetical protein